MSLLGEEDCFNINVRGGRGIKNVTRLRRYDQRVWPAEWEESLWFSPEFYSPATTLLFLSCLLMRFPVKLKPCFSCPILWNSRPLFCLPPKNRGLCKRCLQSVIPRQRWEISTRKSSVDECAAHEIRCVMGGTIKIPLNSPSYPSHYLHFLWCVS